MITLPLLMMVAKLVGILIAVKLFASGVRYFVRLWQSL